MPCSLFISLSVCFYKIIWCDRRNLRIFKISHIAGDNVISSDILYTFILQTINESGMVRKMYVKESLRYNPRIVNG